MGSLGEKCNLYYIYNVVSAGLDAGATRYTADVFLCNRDVYQDDFVHNNIKL